MSNTYILVVGDEDGYYSHLVNSTAETPLDAIRACEKNSCNKVIDFYVTNNSDSMFWIMGSKMEIRRAKETR